MKAMMSLLAAGLLAAPGALAQMEIESDVMYIENEESVFEHNVVVTGDRISMTSDEIRVAQEDGVITARGDPVMLVFERPEGPVQVRARTVAYDPAAGRVLLAAGGRIAGVEVTVVAGWLSADIDAGSVRARAGVQIFSAAAEASGQQLELLPDNTLEIRGEPAKLETTVDGETAQGEAEFIRLADTDAGRLLYLQGAARSVYGGETIAAQKITYNLETGELATEAVPGERVRVVISAP